MRTRVSFEAEAFDGAFEIGWFVELPLTRLGIA